VEKSPKILVVDDSEFIVKLIESTLQTAGYRIVKAYDGEDALKKVASEMPDLIILDVMMPKMTGLEVCRRLKNDEKTMLIPVVLLTAKNLVEDKITGLETGADDYVTKPFNTKELLVRIQGLVQKKISQVKVVEDEKQEALESMAEEVAHEVRNPVTAIGGFARRIKSKLPADSPLTVYADKIISEVERLETMVGEIAGFKGIVVSTHDMVDMKMIMDQVLDEFKDEMTQKNIENVKYYAAETPLLKGDHKNLKLVVTHIIQNAVEAIDNGGAVTLKLDKQNGNVIATVLDSGRGIAEDELKRITRPFYTNKMAGAGMGLVIAKYIVESHGGALLITSVPGEGTSVRISIPVEGRK